MKMLTQATLIYTTPGRGLLDLTLDVAAQVSGSGITTGICHLFLQHTSASLIICENADMDVQRDLEAFMQRLSPDGDPLFRHTMEGPDDMPAHVRTVLTQSALSIPITQGKLALGTWQGLYIWEHRLKSYQRKLCLTLMGE
jgi:secondary thiamine-phosphate synthase enzyme